MPGDVVVPRNTRSILEKYGLQPKKSLGQNFLIDRNIRDKIIDAAAITQNDVVLEIGPGVGTLTEELARRAARVIAVELDGGLVQVLRDRLPSERVRVVEGDVLALEPPALVGEVSPKQRIKIVANLPYYITSPIIFHFLEWKRWEMMVIMVQEEVGERQWPDRAPRPTALCPWLSPCMPGLRSCLRCPAGSFGPSPRWIRPWCVLFPGTTLGWTRRIAPPWFGRPLASGARPWPMPCPLPGGTR